MSTNCTNGKWDWKRWKRWKWWKSDLFPIRVILKLKLNYFDFDSVFIGQYNFSRCTSKYKNVSFDLPRPVNSDYPNYEVLFVSL